MQIKVKSPSATPVTVTASSFPTGTVRPAKPTLTLTSPQTDATPEFALDLTAPVVEDIVTLEIATNAAFTTGYEPYTATLNSTQVNNQSVNFGITSKANGTYYARAKHARAGVNSSWSPTVTATVTVNVPSSYTANAVRFDGTADNLLNTAALTGAVDGKQGIMSFWFNMKGGDAADQQLFTSGAFNFFRTTGNKWRFTLPGAMDIQTTTSFTSTSGWKHCLVAWNLGSTVAQLYISDVDDIAGGAVVLDATVDYTETLYVFGCDAGGSKRINAEIADFYLNLATTLDLTNSANRRKFISAGGKPVDLGTNGATPTGSAPAIFFSGSTAAWHTNKGAGGGFSSAETLTTATTSPSDPAAAVATWNTTPAVGTATFTNSNRTADVTAAETIIRSAGAITGKKVFAVHVDAIAANFVLGLYSPYQAAGAGVGRDVTTVGYFQDGSVNNVFDTGAASGINMSVGDTIGVVVDQTNSRIWVTKDGVDYFGALSTTSTKTQVEAGTNPATFTALAAHSAALYAAFGSAWGSTGGQKGTLVAWPWAIPTGYTELV